MGRASRAGPVLREVPRARPPSLPPDTTVGRAGAGSEITPDIQVAESPELDLVLSELPESEPASIQPEATVGRPEPESEPAAANTTLQPLDLVLEPIPSE